VRNLEKYFLRLLRLITWKYKRLWKCRYKQFCNYKVVIRQSTSQYFATLRSN